MRLFRLNMTSQKKAKVRQKETDGMKMFRQAMSGEEKAKTRRKKQTKGRG